MSVNSSSTAESIDFVTQTVSKSPNPINALCEHVGVIKAESTDLCNHIGETIARSQQFEAHYYQQQQEIQHILVI